MLQASSLAGREASSQLDNWRHMLRSIHSKYPDNKAEVYKEKQSLPDCFATLNFPTLANMREY